MGARWRERRKCIFSVFVCLCDKVTKECEATSVPCDQAQVAISGAQLLLVLCVSGDVAVGGLLLVLVEDVCWMP